MIDKISFFTFSSLLVAISSVILALFLIIKAWTKPFAKLWLFYCLSVFIWGFGSVLFSITEIRETAIFWWQIAFLGAVFSPIIYYRFVYTYLNLKNFANDIIFYLSLIIGIFVFFVDFINPIWFFGGFNWRFNEFYWIDWSHNKNLVFLAVYLFYYWFLLPYSFFLIIKEYRFVKGLIRNQLRYFMLASIVGWTGAHCDFLPELGFNFYPYGNLFIAIYPFIFAYAIFRYKLMDIELIIKKGLIYSVLATTVTALYFIFIIFLEHFFRGFVGYQSFIINICAIFLITIMFNPLRDWIQHWLDKIFFQGTLETLALEKQRLQQELFHKEKLAYVGQLASSVVHEIRNPLTSLMTYVEFLPKKYHEPDFKEKFHSIVPQELKRINNVVNRLLELGKPSSFSFSQVNICALVNETLSLLADHLQLKKINVKRNFESDAIMAQVDPDQMKQVFLNLFLNAIQAMGEGGELTIATTVHGPQSTVDRRPLNVGAKFIQISIRDTGTGMDEETLKKLFTPFMTTKKDGIGLGMVITEEIVREHKGDISVKSKLGEGTEFVVRLPVEI